MSGKATGWALEQPLPPVTKLVLVALADECRRDGVTCFPSRKRLAECVGVEPRTLSRHLAKLEDTGLVKRHERTRENGGRSSNLYELAIETPLDAADKGGVDAADKAPGTPESQGPPGQQRQGHVVEPSQNEPDSPPVVPAEQDEFEEWLLHYRETTGRHATGSASARAAFRARRREGATLERLKLATVGCHRDRWRRQRAHDVPDTILRSANWEGYALEAEAHGAEAGSPGAMPERAARRLAELKAAA